MTRRACKRLLAIYIRQESNPSLARGEYSRGMVGIKMSLMKDYLVI